jgi:hypothetical protein
LNQLQTNTVLILVVRRHRRRFDSSKYCSPQHNSFVA